MTKVGDTKGAQKTRPGKYQPRELIKMFRLAAEFSPDATTTLDDGRLARGRARMRELAKQSTAEREKLTAEILAGLGGRRRRSGFLLAAR